MQFELLKPSISEKKEEKKVESKPTCDSKENSFSNFYKKKQKEEKKSQEGPHPICVHICEKHLIEIKPNISSEKQEATSSLHALEHLTSILVDKLSHQVTKGISKTSIFLGQSEKVPELSGTEIQITCYDTDPHRFHLDFITTPAGSIFLSSQLCHLHVELTSKFPDHFFSIAKPSLNTTFQKQKKSFLNKIDSQMKKNSDTF